MPKPTSNDVLVQQVKQRRAELIEKHSRIVAENIARLLAKKKPTVDELAGLIAEEFEASVDLSTVPPAEKAEFYCATVPEHL